MAQIIGMITGRVAAAVASGGGYHDRFIPA